MKLIDVEAFENWNRRCWWPRKNALKQLLTIEECRGRSDRRSIKIYLVQNFWVGDQNLQ